MGNSTRPRFKAVTLAAAVAAVIALATACSQAQPPKPKPHPAAAPISTPATAPPVGPHGGVDLNVLVVTDGSGAVEAIRQQLTTEGLPSTVIDLRDSSRSAITRDFLARRLPDGTRGGNFDGIVLPSAAPQALSAAEQANLAWYERKFGVRQVDAYSPPAPDLGMSSPPAYSGPLTADAGVTPAGARAGFGYLNGSFPFSGGPAGLAPFGYLAQPLPGGGATPLVTAAIPHSSGSGTLVWRYDSGGRQQLGIGFGYSYGQAQFHYLAHGIVDWLTRGVNLGDWRNYLDIAYDDMFLGDSQWSTVGHCTPGVTTCPKGTPMTATIRMKPADVTYAVQWEQQHHFTIEFLYNGGASARFAVHGVDALLVATRPVAKDFYWVNHTWTHAYFGCQQNFKVVPWQCVRSDGHIVWAAGTRPDRQPDREELRLGPEERDPRRARGAGQRRVLGAAAAAPAAGGQPLPGPPRWAPTTSIGSSWTRRASRPCAPSARPSASPGTPSTWARTSTPWPRRSTSSTGTTTSKADGGSGLCQASTTTRCLRPLNEQTGWTSVIVPGQVQIVFNALINNDPRPFFMHQSNLTGDRLGYPVMDGVLSAYRAVYGPSAPIENLPTDQDGAVLRDQQLWAQARQAGTVTAWVQGNTITISGPPGTPVPVTVPAGTTVGSAAGPTYGFSYAGERSGFTTLGSQPLKLVLGSAPYAG